MNKIKVCHIITKLELGGAQSNTLYTVDKLSKDKFNVLLISGRGGMFDEQAMAMPNAKVIFASYLRRRINPLIDLAALVQLYFILKKEKPDIVHTHSSKAGILGRIASFLSGVPFVIHTFHGFGFHKHQNFIVRYIYILIEKLSASMTDKLITVAHDNVDKALRYSIGKSDKYSVIRSGIDIDKYKNTVIDKKKKLSELGLIEDEKVVTTIGPFKPQKNLLDFIKLAGVVSENMKNVKFLIIGDGVQRGIIEESIKRNSLSGRMMLLGWRSDINEILKVSDIFVMTSLWEGLPRAVLEAMSSSVPVIANDVDGVREAVKHEVTGYLTKPGQIAEMSEYVLKLLKNPDLRGSMAKASRDSITYEFDINYMVKQQEALYTKLAAKI